VRSLTTRLAILAILFGPALDLGVVLSVSAQRGATIDGGAARRSGDKLVEQDLSDDGLDDVTIDLGDDDDVVEPIGERARSRGLEHPLRIHHELARAGRTLFGDLFRPPRVAV
jgi:hypothetical protein